MRYPLLEEGALGAPLTSLTIRLNLGLATNRLGLTSATICFDAVNEDMEEVFGWGECSMLAMAMQEFSAWPYAAVWGPTGQWRHLGVRTPDGHFLDVLGPQRDEDVLLTHPWGSCIDEPTVERLADAYAVPSSGRLDDHSRITPLIGEVVRLLAEQVVNAARRGTALGATA